MLYKVDNIKIRFEKITQSNYREVIIKKLRLNENDVKHFSVLRRSLDSRFHVSEGIYYIYSVSFEYPEKLHGKNISLYVPHKQEIIIQKHVCATFRPVIVGAGPCGIFCALLMVEAGIEPIIIEQGKEIKERLSDVNSFFNGGELITTSNVQFGFGGAGTFSDGKLTTRIKSPLTQYVLEALVKFGADKSILYEAKPHLGTDVLRKIMEKMKLYLQEHGVSLLTETKLTNIIKDANGNIAQVVVNNRDTIECHELVLSVGNASRDTFSMLYDNGIIIKPKSFAVGVRIEHNQSTINNYIYGKYSDDKRLHPAEYSLTYKDASYRGVYTFCNCPGGYVINSSTEQDGVCVNGMSFSSRDAQNANSALVVSVTPDDYENDNPLYGIDFQKKLEQNAYNITHTHHYAPTENICDFMNVKGSKSDCIPTVRPGYEYCDFNDILPEFILSPLKNALEYFAKKIDGFQNGVMTGVETRTSSPIRILRDNVTMESISIGGVYPVGEGCGYAGGIVSSAVDGIKAAQKIINKYTR